MLSLPARLAAVGLAALLAGCATTDDGPFTWSKGWRRGEVLEVARPADMKHARFYKCIREAPPQELETAFLVAKYLQRGRAQRTAVRVPAGEVFRPGDLVYVNVGDCSVAPVRRMSPRPTASAPNPG